MGNHRSDPLAPVAAPGPLPAVDPACHVRVPPQQAIADTLAPSTARGGTRVQGCARPWSKDEPSVSVITMVLNGARCLEATIRSVLNQRYANLEYIVIDGGSSDGTLSMLKRYEDRIAVWMSGPDRGLYDAMNKGVAVATGDWVFFLGCDDIIADPDVIAAVFGNHRLVEPVEFLFGDIQYAGGRLWRSRFDAGMKRRNTVHHQGAFYRRRLFHSFAYNSNFAVSSDYELNLRLYVERAPHRRLDRLIAICGEDGVSSRCSWSGYREEIEIRHKYLHRLEWPLYDTQTALRYCLKKLRLATARSMRCFSS